MISLQRSLLLENGGVISIIGAGGKTSLMFRLAKELSEQGDTVLTTTTTRILMPTPQQSTRVILSDSPREIIEQSRKLLKDGRHISAAAQLMYPRKKMVGLRPGFIDEIHESGLYKWIIVEADGAARKTIKAPALHEPVVPESSKWVVGVMGLDVVNKPVNRSWVFRPERFIELTGLVMGETVTEAAMSEIVLHREGMFRRCPDRANRILMLNKADNPDSRSKGRKIVDFIRADSGTKIKRVVIGQVMQPEAVLEFHDI